MSAWATVSTPSPIVSMSSDLARSTIVLTIVSSLVRRPRPDTKDLPIFTTSTGSSRTDVSELYPVPKSSTISGTPRSRNRHSVDLVLGEDTSAVRPVYTLSDLQVMSRSIAGFDGLGPASTGEPLPLA